MAEIPVSGPTAPTSAAGVPVAPNATTKGLETLTHPTSAAALAAVMAGITAVLASNPQLRGWPDYVTAGIMFLSAAWAAFQPKASTKA